MFLRGTNPAAELRRGAANARLGRRCRQFRLGAKASSALEGLEGLVPGRQSCLASPTTPISSVNITKLSLTTGKEMDSRKAGPRHKTRRSRISTCKGLHIRELGVGYVCNQCVLRLAALCTLQSAAPGGTWANSSKVADTGWPGIGQLRTVQYTHALSHTDTPLASSDEHVQVRSPRGSWPFCGSRKTLPQRHEWWRRLATREVPHLPCRRLIGHMATSLRFT